MRSYRILLFTLIIACSLLLAGGFLKTPSAVASPPEADRVAYPCYHVTPAVDPLVSGFTVNQIRSAYNLPPAGGSGTIAIIDAYNASTVRSDLAVFNAQFGLPDADLEIFNMTSRISRDSGWAVETTLDVEWAHAIAPNAKILLVQARTSNLGNPSSGDLLAAIDYARSRADVVAISMSWGTSEWSSETSFDSHFSSSFGATFFASSGDDGSGTIWPATSPSVVAVGGTVLSFSGDAFSSETGWSGSGGGISSYEPMPFYQSAYGVPASRRAIPDVSYNAVNFPVYLSGRWITVGGTSAGAPQWAAIQALGLTANNGNFYQDAQLSSYPHYFRDITIGSNGGFSAGTGYDFVTGVGSPLTTDFTPSGSPATTITLLPAGQSTPLSPSNGFTVTYTNGGTQQSDFVQTTLTVDADSGTNVVISGASTGSTVQERWVFNSNADSFTVAAGTSQTLYYYDLLSQMVNYTIVGGGTPANPTLSYVTAPATASDTPQQTAATLQLSQLPAQTIWSLRGSAVSPTNPILGSSTERWLTPTATWTITSSNQVSTPITYFHQYFATFTYQILGGGSPAPTLTATSLAVTSTTQLFTSPSTAWLDAGTQFALSNPLPLSTSTERWSTLAGTSGAVSGPVTFSATFFHQFNVSPAYALIGGGTPTAPDFTYTSYGSPASTQLTGTQQALWADSGTPYSTPLQLVGSTAAERWSNPANSGTVQAATAPVFSYFHQFNVSAAYSLVGGGTPAAPTLSLVGYGNLTTLTLSGSPQLFWADSNSLYSAPSQLGGSTTTERWTTSVNQGLIQGSAALNLTYYHEFLLNVTGAKVTTQWFNSGETAQTSVSGVFNRTSGTGQRVTSYSVDSGNPTSVSPTTGIVLISILMDAPHQLQINSATQYQITLDSASTRMMNSITQPTIGGDSYWYDAGTPVLAQLNGVFNRTAGTGERLTSYSVNGAPTATSTINLVAVLNISSLLSPQAVAATVTSQYQLTTPSGSVRSTTAPSIAGDMGWYDAGTPVTVTYDYTWNAVPGQSRLNAVSYTINPSAPTPLTRQGSGTFSVQVQMTQPKSIAISSVTQYAFSVTGGNNVALSQGSPTGDSYYDSGTALAASTDNIWGLQGGNTRQNLQSYTLDGSVNAIARANSGRFTTATFTFSNAHALVFNSATQYQVTLDSTAAAMLNSITPPTISGDNYWYDAGTPVKAVLNGVGNRAAGTGVRLTSYSVNGASNSVLSLNPVEVLNSASLLSPQTVLATVTPQYQLSTPSGSLKSISAPTLPGDAGWYDIGTAVTATYDYSWNNAGQSRLNAVGYAVGQGATTPLARLSSGEFSVQVVMAHPESIAVSSVTQYSFSVSGGFNVVLSQVSPTSDAFYDLGMALSVTTDNLWGLQGGNTRQNLVSYTLDGATTSITRADTGTLTTQAFVFDRAHVLTFNAATQYLAKFQFTDSSGTVAITPSSFQIDIGNSGIADVPQFSLWLDSGTQIQIQSVMWQSVDVKPAGQTGYTANSPLNVTIQCRIFNAQIRVIDDQGNPAAGAQVIVTLANQTTISGVTDANGTLSLPMIPLGTFTATITYSGATTTVTGDASGQAVTTAVIFLPLPPSPSPSSTTLPVIPEMTPPAAVIAIIAVALALALAIRKRSPPKP